MWEFYPRSEGRSIAQDWQLAADIGEHLMSVMPPKAEVAIHGADVRYVPLAEVAMKLTGASATVLNRP